MGPCMLLLKQWTQSRHAHCHLGSWEDSAPWTNSVAFPPGNAALKRRSSTYLPNASPLYPTRRCGLRRWLATRSGMSASCVKPWAQVIDRAVS